MGGGGVMKTLANVAGISNMLNDCSASIARLGSRGAPAVVSAAGVSAKTAVVAPLQTDDWDFAGDGVLVMAAGEPMPRVVFGAVPTIKEAKDATNELKGAIDEIYFSSVSSQCDGSSNPPVPVAFQLLSTSAMAQNVVASLVSDQNIWNGVMQNPVFNNYCQSCQTVEELTNLAAPSENDEACYASSEAVETFEKEEAASDSEKGGHAVDASDAVETPENVEAVSLSGEGFLMCLWKNLKRRVIKTFSAKMRPLKNMMHTVTEKISSLLNYLQNIFATLEKKNPFADADGSSKAGNLLGLALIVVFMVLLKRLK
ncbi:uncharacterized protein LOC133298303 [Gastrolobium bilobum]|uniref:uncharacterized protein LOC133298303 n=1 Tax=Gastrolobium bilobum TaxID=150636 RepID=UPI002AAFDF49|nr:uncharacterized protein LOC133298303 [Gastrolobium bilobum]